EDLIDEIIIFRSNKIIGGDGISMIDGLAIDEVKKSISAFRRMSVKEFDDDIVEHLVKA
ncbi:MAG: riboflavin biosynthesis protein RibD, partial [Rickettsiales bacterium]|nr:riboflavin biosynthesis protein RibD [Rickettsiales bacterium]